MATDESTSAIDWEFAASVGGRLAGTGPILPPDEAAETVAELREDAAIATGHVRNFTHLVAPYDVAPVLVVDRQRWVRANAQSFQSLMQPVVDKALGSRPSPALVKAAGAKVTGAELGGILGFLSSKVLGQFDPFHGEAGRLLLVAPNVVHIERELEVDPRDFRLWVCLHEETHRVQFTANPWLAAHLKAEIANLTGTLDMATILDEGFGRIVEAFKPGGPTLMEVLSTPEQREVIDRITGVMSLLEGHADVVMDGVGPAVIPSVDHIRTAFTGRRKGVGVLDRLIRRLMGMDAKMAQYRDGAAFVRTVVDKVGMDDFNAIWTGPDTLPSKAEIFDPETWVKRVL
ncbi:hypothetical protein Back2_20640 [Nocardioides baekrokdamisoli]|uniref:Coenzyme F420 biosynthesis-associated protein n=1 Tax=Nocardioides baekrokdamisoli TaxID=1804624 RepID=A0A3G9IFN8_9ACTN|nr:zinc-dependent metalloprotease [Nocardioides baekrokdamisoli]BBH17777.1 hypothetical protein Back2_20640 [Nocardioides baekrokdamisoli]